jgi:ribosome-associated toxin RatA of RatAB toxin-antitoxin module
MALSIHKSHISPFPIEAVYKVVVDVEHYQDFIPWCQKSTIVKRINDNHFKADLKVGLGPLSDTYRSTVECDPFSRIHVFCQEKPLKHLESTWTFKELSEQQTQINYDMIFSLQSSFFQGMIQKILQQSTDQIFTAFDQRLAHVHKQGLQI